ncbi:CoA transferase [Gordonia sp. TBRC 11910]|uniref:CoA transferase n=1 Tax=Gordonia asplenii TaxID=2725283 RepID=A0A848KT46_9ACTN|nr:CoA transferase [Gordonia asplenii]NMO00055.1 CoA transferase [Gordonia asplenii]
MHTFPKTTALPLHGLRVLTVVDELLPSLGKILADLGAMVDVIADPDVVVGDEVAYSIDSRGKRMLDTGDRPLGEIIEAALPITDVLLCGPRIRGISHSDIVAAHPELLVAVISDFGLTGVRRDWVGTEAVYQALGGTLARSGEPGRPPLLPPGELFRLGAAEAIAVSIVGAMFSSLRGPNRLGGILDCSIFEAGMTCLDPAQGMTGSGTPDFVPDLGRPAAGDIYPVFSVRDGYVRVCVLSLAQWESMLDWMGRPTHLCGDELKTNPGRYARAHLVVPALGDFFSSMTVAEMVAECVARRIPAAEVLSVSDVLTEPHFREIGIFVDDACSDGVRRTFPEGMVHVDGTRCAARTQPPTEPRIVPAGHKRPTGGPLAGVTVLDLGVIVAGAQTGQLLAELGARVIRIENTAFPDGMRRSFESLTPALARGHMGKENLGLNLRSAEGLAIFRELVAHADVVCSNFKPGTAEKLGIGHDDLAAINPEIITVESSAFGAIGPRRHSMGYGPLVRALTGLSWLWRENADASYFSDGITIYPDHLAARVSAVAVAACLLNRLRTGRGAHISLAQSDIGLIHLAPYLARESEAPGSVQPPGSAPGALLSQQVFATRGPERWCVIDPRTPEQLDRVYVVLGTASRDTAAIADAVADRDGAEVAEALQAAGVPAAPMLSPGDLPDDAGLSSRDFYTTTSVSGTEQIVPVERAVLIVDGRRAPTLGPAPAFGEHTWSILRELGYDSPQIASLLERGAVEESDLAAKLRRAATNHATENHPTENHATEKVAKA